mmetsp:Transcript_14530/g.40072  ORF Transcript_14530/g.40072 Transcript_14530/m.40072 type:complete len:220 (-) Transcript_14530:1417-2076(-)
MNAPVASRKWSSSNRRHVPTAVKTFSVSARKRRNDARRNASSRRPQRPSHPSNRPAHRRTAFVCPPTMIPNRVRKRMRNSSLGTLRNHRRHRTTKIHPKLSTADTDRSQTICANVKHVTSIPNECRLRLDDVLAIYVVGEIVTSNLLYYIQRQHAWTLDLSVRECCPRRCCVSEFCPVPPHQASITDETECTIQYMHAIFISMDLQHEPDRFNFRSPAE